MEDFNTLDGYPWPDDLYDDTGEIDSEKLLEILEANPDLMQQFQEMYGNEGSYLSDADAQFLPPQTLQDLFFDCMQPNISSAMESIAPLLAACILCSVITRYSTSHTSLTQIAFSLLGLLILYRFFKENTLILLIYTLMACVPVQSKRVRTKAGVLLSVLTIVFVVACEFIIPAERWHNVRGAQMVLSMKAISLGFDLSNESLKEAPLLDTIGYLLHPGSVIFGPWISYQYYVEGISSPRSWLDWKWQSQIAKSFLLSAVYLIWSSCATSYLLPAHYSYGKWVDAYRDAQSFRFSHYFVCSLAETTLLLSGVGVFSASGELSAAVQVSQPLNIELPRSLVEVVTSWNLPMHKWLKNYVFKLVKPKYGGFTAILVTYIASSLLHGLNFQLAAVLLSLGLYSYVEHSLRHKVADVFGACVEARRCSNNPCNHRRGYLHSSSVIINIGFTCLAMYHLAYLGVMFDTSELEQEKGYSMLHTLSKWKNLGYSSHIVVLCTYLFYLLIK